ncbi:MAG: hypothetical protein LJE96_17225 [Deltaproteobacteria bacterium]|nr:hypothetical protein [Deltaproteobacteria bacterium]
MSKLKITGLVAWILSALILGFQTMSSFMNSEGVPGMVGRKNLTLVDVAGKNYLNWINNIPWVSIQKAVNYVVNAPLFLSLFCFGILCFLINAFKAKA